MPRWVKVSIAIVVTLLVLGGVGELGLRSIIPGIVQSQLRDQLNLPKNHPVDVELGGSALVYALQGDIGDIDVEVPDAPVTDDVIATLGFHADRVPFSVTSGDITGASASVFVSSAQLGPVISLVTGGLADDGRTQGGTVVVGKSVDAFGFSVPLEGRLKLSVIDGDVKVEPTGLSAVGFDLDTDQIVAATGGLLEPLLSPRVVCVSDQIPAGITLEHVKVATGGVRIDALLAPDFLSNPEQLELGSCE
ncbi:MAG: LmeA family phospholipid-binding protein [Leucobacter sp.]